MQINKYRERVETPVPFLYRKFERYEWRRQVNDLEVLYYDDMIWRAIGDIDDLNLPLHKKIQVMHKLMNKFPIITWFLYLKKAEYINVRDSVITYIYDDIEIYLDNLNNEEYAQEQTLLLLYTVLNSIYNCSIDISYYNSFISKVSDILFIYNLLVCVNVKQMYEYDCILNDIIDLVIEDIDMIMDNDYRIRDFMESQAYNSYLDPSMVEFGLYVEEEYDTFRSTCIDYITNVIKYCGFRNSPFIRTEYENLNMQLARYFNNNYREAVFKDVNMLIIYHVVKSVLIFYEDEIVYDYKNAYELTKYIKFLFKDIPIDFTKIRYY